MWQTLGPSPLMTQFHSFLWLSKKKYLISLLEDNQETVIVIRYIFPVNPRQQCLPGKHFSICILSTATLKSSSCYSSSSFASLPNPKLLSQAVGTSVKTWIKVPQERSCCIICTSLVMLITLIFQFHKSWVKNKQTNKQTKRINFNKYYSKLNQSVSKISQLKRHNLPSG